MAKTDQPWLQRRSIGKRGYRVIVTSDVSCSLASCSRYCALSLKVPDPLQHGFAYTEEIDRIVRQHAIDIIVPMTEQSIFLINKTRSFLPKNVILACANEAKMQAVSNKSSLFLLAESLGVPIPKTIYISSANDIEANIHKLSQYPVVIKPSLSKQPHGDGFVSGGVMYAKNFEDLRKYYAANPILAYPFDDPGKNQWSRHRHFYTI